MPIQEYDIRRPEAEGGGLDERFWSIVHHPVLGADQEVAYIIHRVEDVTEVVHRRRAHLAGGHESTTDDVSADGLEREVFLRTREVAESNRRLKEANVALAQTQETIRDLSTPILPIKRSLLLVPVIGQLDPERAAQLTFNLLEAVSAAHARAVVLDLTGLAELDAAVARHLHGTVAACRLMGATVVLSGLSIGSADAILSHGGINPAGLISAGDLEDGIERALQLLDTVDLTPAAQLV
jgi:anti-anti-sigma regulatory factor